MIQIRYVILSILLIINISLGDKTSTEIQEDINSRNNELESLKNEIDRYEVLINEKSKQEKLNNEVITQINKKIELTEKLIKRLTDEENYISKQIYKTKGNIEKQEQELFILKNQLKNRLRYLYKYGKSNLLKQITQTNDWNKKIYRTKYLEILNEYENQIKIKIKTNLNDYRIIPKDKGGSTLKSREIDLDAMSNNFYPGARALSISSSSE